MKFSLFVHMERVSADEPQQRLYQEMLELCQIADENGMHAIWTGEHHGMDFTIAPNPFLNLVDLARRTKNVRLGWRCRCCLLKRGYAHDIGKPPSAARCLRHIHDGRDRCNHAG